jgi:hypothetical protein
MPKRQKVDRPVEKSISLPRTVCTKVDLLLWSDLEMKVPHGAWARYINDLIEADLAMRARHAQQAKS